MMIKGEKKNLERRKKIKRFWYGRRNGTTDVNRHVSRWQLHGNDSSDDVNVERQEESVSKL